MDVFKIKFFNLIKKLVNSVLRFHRSPKTELNNILLKIKSLIKLMVEKKLLKKYKNEIIRLKNEKMASPVRLQFGCGPRILKDWINIDISFQKHEEYEIRDLHSKQNNGACNNLFIIDITKISLPLNDNSVECIFHEDFIEHLCQKDQIIFLAETYRVLKPGCVHRINTPDLNISLLRSEFNKGRVGVNVSEWNDHDHINVLSKNYLREIASIIGYSDIKFYRKNVSKSSLIPEEIRPGNDRKENENFFCDLIK